MSLGIPPQPSLAARLPTEEGEERAWTGFRWRLLGRVGEGAESVVWRAVDGEGREVALKVAKAEGTALREAELVARIGRRWGPALVDAGTTPPALEYVALEWTEGEPLRLPSPARVAGGREKLAAVVAHGVARALAELHEAGVRHGDVKPTNVVLSGRMPSRDVASARGATLIDLGLAGALHADLKGGTPRYLAPEAVSGGLAGPASDLFALGLVLAEILDPEVAAAPDPRARVQRWGRAAKSEPARWAEALLAEAPGGRPSAEWIGARAARWLALAEDEEEQARARAARVRRAYLATRSREIAGAARASPRLEGLPRAWVEEAIAWSVKIGRARPTLARPLEPLDALGRTRWLVALVGPTASAWPMALEGSEAELAARLLELAATRAPSSWTLEEVTGRRAPADAWRACEGADRIARLARELAQPRPSSRAVALAEDDVARGVAPPTLALELARVLLRAGETGRAWAALAGARDPEADALRAEIARRRGDRAEAARAAARAASSSSSARATLARLAWEAGDLAAAERHLDGATGPGAAEVRALVAYRRGHYEVGLRVLEEALAQSQDAEAGARLEASRGLLEHARGRADESLRAFGRAVEVATRSGALVEEATYLTSEAAAATDVGQVDRALASATRAALLWERLARPADAARAWLSRAAALATIGAAHAADEAAVEARWRSLGSGDARAAAYARWAHVEVRPPGDERARDEAIAADAELRESTEEDRARAAARLLVWAPDALDDARVDALDRAVPAMSAAARWEWWGARAAALRVGRAKDGATPSVVLGALAALVDLPAPLASRGPALDAAVHLATERGDGEAARRFEFARRAAVQKLREGTPPALRACLAQVPWARAPVAEADVTFAPAQIAQLEAIVRSLATRDGLRPLLDQVLDTLVLWTGVERGLLLMRAPDGRLVPRAARNLARRDLRSEQLALSQGVARRAIESGDAVVATDAFSTLGDMHASAHALGLRSVLAVPLIVRGETLGVVYLDDRARRGAFGDRELAWVRVVASQAAMAIADARDQVLLKRAARRAERSRREVEALLGERERELDATRTELKLTRADGGSRYAYDAIVGRSEPMRAMLRLVDRVTASDIPVLIVGESGTGKELVARALHANGVRAGRAFVSENCASVPESLLESTLFGHVKGAFTGASSTRAGLFDVADGGTLFLDEIGEMPLAMQSKLLRVLEDGEVRAVGGERTRRVDVRVLGATHRNLEAMVARGAFREDLFYRLNVISIAVPPLRERRDDIPLLVAHFIQKHAGGRRVKVTRAAMEKLAHYPWPGNVRQLENEIRRAIVLGDDALDVQDLSPEVRLGSAAARGAGVDLRSRVDALEVELVREALEKTRGNQTRAAELLGVSRFGLQKMMKRLGIR